MIGLALFNLSYLFEGDIRLTEVSEMLYFPTNWWVTYWLLLHCLLLKALRVVGVFTVSIKMGGALFSEGAQIRRTIVSANSTLVQRSSDQWRPFARLLRWRG